MVVGAGLAGPQAAAASQTDWAKPQKHPRNIQKTAVRKPVIPDYWETSQLGCGPNPTSLGSAPVIRALPHLITHHL